MARASNLSLLLTFTILAISWLICFSFMFQYLFLNIDYIKGHNYIYCDYRQLGCNKNAQILATTAHQILAYFTTLFVLYHCRELN